MAKVRAVPEGLHTITPQLIVSDGAKFLEFARRAFGAEEVSRMMHPSGKGIWHASIRVGGSTIFVSDESLSETKSAKTLGMSPFTLQVNVENADQLFKQAMAAGATVEMPLMDMFWGDRYGLVKDPFGNRWAISTHIKDPTPAELEKGAKEAAIALEGKKH